MLDKLLPHLIFSEAICLLSCCPSTILLVSHLIFTGFCAVLGVWH